MTPPKQASRLITDLYKDFLKAEEQQQHSVTQKAKFVKELISEQEKLDKSLANNKATQEQNKKIELLNKKIREEAVKNAESENKKNELQNQIKEAKTKLKQHITDAQNSKDKKLLAKSNAAEKELKSYNELFAKTDKKKQEEEKKLREAVNKAEKDKLSNTQKAEEKIKSDYIKQRDNLFESAQNICAKTEQIIPAVKEILEIDFTKKASKQKLTIAKAAAKALTTGLDNSVSIAKIVTSANYYVKEVKKIDIADSAKTGDSFFVKLLSDGKTQELLRNTLPQINKVAEEVAPILVSKTLDYLEKTGKKYEKQEAKTKDFAARKEKIILQVAECLKENQKLPKELQQQFDAIQKEEEAISKAHIGEKQSSIRQSLGKTISALKNRGFNDEHINDTFVPIMSSVIHNASNKPQEVTGAIKAVVDLGLASNSQEQAKAVTELLLSELIRDTLKDQAIQNLATNQTGFVTATIQEIVKNNNSLADRAKKIGVTDESIRDLTEMATGVVTTGLKFGGKLLDGLSNEREEVEKVIDVTIQTGKKIAKIIDDNKELKTEHIAVITDELKVVANNALELMNRESVQDVIQELGADIAQDKELPKIIKQGVKTIAKIAAPEVTNLGNFDIVVDFAVDLGLNITSAGLKGADTVNSLVRNTVLPVATNIAITVLKNTDKINDLARQVKDITEESKKQQNNNTIEKATNVVNNGLEVASNVMNLLNDQEIRGSLAKNLNKLGEGLQSAKYVESLVTTVAQNILPASEIIDDRDIVNRVIADTAILAEKTAAALLSEEQNISAVFDGATHGVAVAKSLLSSDKQTVATADSISKVVESAAVLLTDENVSKVISEKIPDYIATHGQTFIDAITSQFATRKAKKAAPAEELLAGEVVAKPTAEYRENVRVASEINVEQDQSPAAEDAVQTGIGAVLEQPAASDEIQQETVEIVEEIQEPEAFEFAISEAAPNKKPSSKEKAIEVVGTVAKNVTNILNILQSEEGRESKGVIVSNLAKLGHQIEDKKYIQEIVPKIFTSLMASEKNAQLSQENPMAPKPLDTDQQKDPMAPEEAKITSQDIVQTVKSIKDIANISQLVKDSSALTEQIVSIALKQSGAAINIATSLIALGQNASEVLARKLVTGQQTEQTEASGVDVGSNDVPQMDTKAQKIVADDRELVQELNETLAKNILIIANNPEIQELVTNKLPSYIQGNKETILALTKQLTGQYQAQIEAIGLSEEVINQTAELSVKLLTDKNIAPIYELVGNVVNNAGMLPGGAQSDIALLIDHIYNVAINKGNSEAQKETVQNAINKIGDIIFSANTHDQVRSVVTQNIPRLLKENEKAIAGLAEEFLERTVIGQKISSRISIDVERALKVAEKKSGTFLSLLENYHKKNYTGIVKNIADLATSPKVIKFLGSTAARTIHRKIKGSHADRVNKRRPISDQRGR